MGHWNGPRHGHGHVWGGWGFGLMALVSLAVLVVLVLVAVALVRHLSRSSRPVPPAPWGSGGQAGVVGPPRAVSPTAEHLLAERFARGEIDAEEYRQRLDVLRGANGPGVNGPGGGAAGEPPGGG
ncbi:SHOCT domain-containing protein [Kitasatospora sp. NPDC091207]|uniref:SHOCT domain-containing protein n=1 Tax=Kitasatospora sp. NPDC091207 TaxID=3364083 RepID=UPI0038308903